MKVRGTSCKDDKFSSRSLPRAKPGPWSLDRGSRESTWILFPVNPAVNSSQHALLRRRGLSLPHPETADSFLRTHARHGCLNSFGCGQNVNPQRAELCTAPRRVQAVASSTAGRKLCPNKTFTAN
ncbi:hypothetical protein AAFF_G00038830 [Aldrovandia affinis]|uniref:Uncharacterized protein n=1 Tax=Aldrovandia affinis TaxID=143900 RepID=A0AAD7T6X9_9TELE|nr:hypothetical protein AAFF_G00038830 [Aldrovandia affinis]